MRALSIGALLCAIAVAPAVNAEALPGTDQSALGSRAIFYVGGEYVGPDDAKVMQGQMFVEMLAPKTITKPYPLVLFHTMA